MNDDPKLMNGSGIPVMGMRPIVIPMFSRIWNVHIAMTPATINDPKQIARLRGDLKRGHEKRKIHPKQKAPRRVNPNSSPVTEKMKSVYGAGRKSRLVCVL